MFSMESDVSEDLVVPAQRNEVLDTILVYVAQGIVYPAFLALRLLFVRTKIYRDKSALDLRKLGDDATYVLYANHQSKLDPLIICTALPFRTVRQLLPFRFFVENSYLKGATKHLLNALGGFPAHYDPYGLYGLDKARTAMEAKQTVMIFPPGMRTRERRAKPGISALALEPNAYLIPVHIEWEHRRRCRVYIGDPVKSGIADSPEHLMQKVYDLPLRFNE